MEIYSCLEKHTEEKNIKITYSSTPWTAANTACGDYVPDT